jgi:hypothetical protein
MKPTHLLTSSIILWAVFGLLPLAHASLTVLGTSQDGLLAVDKQGNLWGTNQKEGKFAQQVVKFTGKSVHFSRTGYSASLIKKLKPKGSNVAHNVEGHIAQVWPLPDGTVLFMAEVKAKSFLYKLNPKANSVGNNQKLHFNNKQAVMNVGERYDSTKKKRIHYEDIRGLHQRSLLVAKVAGKTVLFFGEYNIRAKRSPGRGNDAVALWRSTDMGNTWGRVVEWNTNGVHVVRHIHGLKQNPHNGWIYILFGDNDRESGIVAWDGVSKAIPNNTSLVKIGLNKYKGWKAISGSQDMRAGDIVFTKNKCIWLPDIDFIGQGTLIYGQEANHNLTGFRATNPFYFGNGSSPIIAEIDSKGTIYWASFRAALNHSTTPPTVTEKKVYLWSSTNSGFTWSLPVSIPVYNDWSSVPQNLFLSPWGTLVLGGRGVIFAPKGNVSGSSIYFNR